MTKPNFAPAGRCIWCDALLRIDMNAHAHWCPSEQNAELISIEYDAEGRERARFYRSPKIGPTLESKAK